MSCSNKLLFSFFFSIIKYPIIVLLSMCWHKKPTRRQVEEGRFQNLVWGANWICVVPNLFPRYRCVQVITCSTVVNFLDWFPNGSCGTLFFFFFFFVHYRQFNQLNLFEDESNIWSTLYNEDNSTRFFNIWTSVWGTIKQLKTFGIGLVCCGSPLTGSGHWY